MKRGKVFDGHGGATFRFWARNWNRHTFCLVGAICGFAVRQYFILVFRVRSRINFATESKANPQESTNKVRVYQHGHQASLHCNQFCYMLELIQLPDELPPSFSPHACSTTVYTIVSSKSGRSLQKYLGLLLCKNATEKARHFEYEAIYLGITSPRMKILHSIYLVNWRNYPMSKITACVVNILTLRRKGDIWCQGDPSSRNHLLRRSIVDRITFHKKLKASAYYRKAPALQLCSIEALYTW